MSVLSHENDDVGDNTDRHNSNNDDYTSDMTIAHRFLRKQNGLKS